MENEVQGFQFEPLKERISRSTNSDSDSSWETCDDSMVIQILVHA